MLFELLIEFVFNIKFSLLKSFLVNEYLFSVVLFILSLKGIFIFKFPLIKLFFNDFFLYSFVPSVS